MLARIDSTRFEAGTRQSEAAVQGARADLARAQADLEATKLAFERNKRMHAEKLISDQAMDQAQAELKMKEAQVDAQRRRIAQTAAVPRLRPGRPLEDDGRRHHGRRRSPAWPRRRARS